jgi:FKBP-type peptidyl-prolyl cis-trans isomerase FklB
MSRSISPRLALAAALLLSAAALSGPALAAAPGGTAPPVAPLKPPAAVTPEMAQASHSIGLSLAKPLREKIKRSQLSMPQIARGLKDALLGKEVTPEQQMSVQALVNNGGAGDKVAVSYNMGLAMGQPLHANFLSVDTLSIPDIIRGIEEVLDGGDSSTDTQQQAFDYMTKNKRKLADQNQALALAFLASNRDKPGVVTTATGLQYKILEPGKGTPPAVTDTVWVRYTGKLLDGTEFDGTDLNNNEPVSFPVDGVIKGWEEALLLMKPGAKWELYIPPVLGYDVDSKDPIPPSSLLLFTVELVKVERVKAEPAAK